MESSRKRKPELDREAESSRRSPTPPDAAPRIPVAPYSDDVEDDDRGNDHGQRENDHGVVEPVAQRRRQVKVCRDCPYLDTVNRQVLDFDFEKFCSISLSNLNVYACLVCGKYYQGRGLNSHAYTHSLEAGHCVYINLHTEKVYCLPHGYEINDPSLDDIRHVLNPRFSNEEVLHLDENRQWSRALDGSNYLPGMVGLNNIKKTDFVNVIIQSLMRVTPLRNFFLVPENYQHCKSPLVQRFGELTQKIWHAQNFKGQVSPHEFLQAVMKAGNKQFQIGVQSDPVEFMSWLLNTLNMQLRHSKKKNKTIILDCFQGELEVVKVIQKKPLMEKKETNDENNKEVAAAAEDKNDDFLNKEVVAAAEDKNDDVLNKEVAAVAEDKNDDVLNKEVVAAAEDKNDDVLNKEVAAAAEDKKDDVLNEKSRVPFLMLGLDLPPPPLFKDAIEKNIIPQVPLFNILKKFDGESVTEVVRPHMARMRYRVTRLPKYLILHMLRFTKNNFFIEKNPTLVNFPVKNLELKDYIPLQTPKEDEKMRSKYDLIANITHDGKPGEGFYRAFVQCKSEELWYEMQDLHVTETLPQMVALSEAYMQIYEQHE